MSLKKCIWLALLLASVLLGQSDRGTITGSVTDPSGATIPEAQVNIINIETDLRYQTVTTGTGNYTAPSLPAGTYRLTVEAKGFNRFEATGVRVQVAVTTRLDVAMQVGPSATSVVVSADAGMLKTESAEQSTTITGDKINSLPVNFGIGAGAIRNPLSFVQLTPGANIGSWNSVTVNGMPSYSFKIIFEGQESSSGLDARVSDESQPSVEAIQEFTLQTSNFAAEFGQVSGGLFNFTSRSGTNQFHGSAYIYASNEALNAGIPFTNRGNNEHLRPAKKLYDYGFSAGGPVWIPKIYQGKNRTFFYFNLERYRDRESLYNGIHTLPTDAFRKGDLSAMLTGRSLGTDFMGRNILENSIYDPGTTTTDSSGRLVRQVFPNNVIPTSQIDPVSAKILALVPKPDTSSLVNNTAFAGPFWKLQSIPSVKIDHSITSSARLSGYWSMQATDKLNGQDGLPRVLSLARDQTIRSQTIRLNLDQTLSPTLLMHLGAGVQLYRNPDTAPPVSTEFDSAGQLGLKGAPGTGFPRIGTLGNDVYGGLTLPIGATSRGLFVMAKPTGVAQFTWVHENHTYKAGGEWKIDTYTNKSDVGLAPSLGFGSGVTSQNLYGQALPSGTAIGNSFATFLLGQYDGGSVGNSTDPQYRKSGWGFFVQDTWKVTRKLTFDYGIRYDLQKPERELWRRTSTFRADVVNPNANGRLGGVLYEGTGPGRCNCTLVKTYPYAFAPRLGLAYQITPKTVLRAGWGLAFASTAAFNYIGAGNSQGMGYNTINFTAPQSGVPVGKLSDGLVYDHSALYAASYNPGLLVVPGAAVQGSPSNIDPNGGRPPRINQWNISLQRELVKNVVAEGAYVGNRAAWLQAGGNLINYNMITPETYRALGIDITNAADRTLLSSTITSAVAVARGFKKPYANFPDSGSVLQSLKPFPQYSGVGSTWVPLGHSWYDAFQMKVTSRNMHGFEATLAYAFSKTLNNFNGNGNVMNRGDFKSLDPNDHRQLATISLNYVTQAKGILGKNRFARTALAGWAIGSILQYQDGPLLAAPGSTNSIGSYYAGSSSRQFRVPGQPLYLKDINGKLDPTQDIVLNPAAWVDQAPGVWGSGAVYYSDFRGKRRPVESINIGKRFPIKERLVMSLRAEFFNILNRMEVVSDPSTGSPSNPPTRNNGLLTGGFGYMNYTNVTSNSVAGSLPAPRNGQVVIRFEF
jgi:hypothetical protein